MAGGTGGHVFPALAVANVLRDRGVGVVWLGVPASMESRLVPANGFPIEWVRVAGIRGKGLAAWMLAPLRIVTAVAQTIARAAPRAAARGAGRRRLCQRAGRHRRMAAAHPAADPRAERHRRARPIAGWRASPTQVLEAFPGSFSAGVHARTIGNPVRADIAALPRAASALRRSRTRERACWCSAAARARSA